MLNRRQFIGKLAVGTGLLASHGLRLPVGAAEAPDGSTLVPAGERPAYGGPNVILVRFGGGVRRQETITPQGTFCPYFLNELVPRGTFFPRLEIAQHNREEGKLDTSHGQGTLNLLTGRYDSYRSVSQQVLGERFEPAVPTLFEYLRQAYAVPAEQTLFINGEDRLQEEFYSFSNHHSFGVNYRCYGLSLFRFRHWLLSQQARQDLPAAEQARVTREWQALQAHDSRGELTGALPEPLAEFWREWQRDYGASGLRQPRGDDLLTELAARALRRLQPRLLLVNYNDPDYVHWGNPTHYTRAITIIDEGLRRLVELCDSLPFYRERTIMVIVPDCGRDDNRLLRVPYQHHFNSVMAHQIFALFMGPGVARKQVVDRVATQTSVTATIGRLMNFATPHAEAPVLDEVFP